MNESAPTWSTGRELIDVVLATQHLKRTVSVALIVGTAFFDMTAYWGKYVRESGKDLKWFKRDAIHANERGMQVIGRLLAGHLAPPVTRP